MENLQCRNYRNPRLLIVVQALDCLQISFILCPLKATFIILKYIDCLNSKYYLKPNPIVSKLIKSRVSSGILSSF